MDEAKIQFAELMRKKLEDAMRARMSAILDTDNMDSEKQAQEIIKRAEQGDPEAQLLRGMQYEDGLQGVDLSLEEATKWYKLAAEQV